MKPVIKIQTNKLFSFGKYKNLTLKEAKEKEKKYFLLVDQLRTNEELRNY